MSQPCKCLVLRVGLNQLIRYGGSGVWGLTPISLQSAKNGCGVSLVWSLNRCAGVWGSRAPVDAWQDVENVVHHAPTAKAIDCNRHSNEAEQIQRILTLKSVTFSFSPSCSNFTLAPLSPCVGCVSAQQGVRPEWCGPQEGVWGGAAWMLAAVLTGAILTWSLMCSTVAEVQAGLCALWHGTGQHEHSRGSLTTSLSSSA